MDILIFKLVAAPLLIGAASLAARRWGETVSGWLIGLPLTSGPVCFFLAVEQGSGFAAAAAPMRLIAPPLWLLAAVAYLALVAALRLMPRLTAGRARLPAPPRWDLPARMIVATVLVLALTELAPAFGARLSGLLATYPLS